MKSLRRWQKITIGLGVALGLILFSQWPTDILAWPLVRNEQPVPADVIIVLGSGTRRGIEPVPPQGQARVQKALTLQKAGYSHSMIVTGGYSRWTGKVEATTMKNYAEVLGADPALILEEPLAKNTIENALLSYQLMRDQGWDSALVVTSDYHTRRACHIFHKLPITVHCVAAHRQLAGTYSPKENFLDFRSVIREYGAWVYYYVRQF